MSNLVVVSEMDCNEREEKSCELIQINEDYVAIGKSMNCYLGYGKHQLTVNSIFSNFDNLRAYQSWNEFEEPKLPPKKAFHSNLNMSDISKYHY